MRFVHKYERIVSPKGTTLVFQWRVFNTKKPDDTLAVTKDQKTAAFIVRSLERQRPERTKCQPTTTPPTT